MAAIDFDLLDRQLAQGSSGTGPQTPPAPETPRVSPSAGAIDFDALDRDLGRQAGQQAVQTEARRSALSQIAPATIAPEIQRQVQAGLGRGDYGALAQIAESYPEPPAIQPTPRQAAPTIAPFGGAYAVLAYMAQQAVDNYHWLTAGEMLDGLGLAEGAWCHLDTAQLELSRQDLDLPQ